MGETNWPRLKTDWHEKQIRNPQHIHFHVSNPWPTDGFGEGAWTSLFLDLLQVNLLAAKLPSRTIWNPTKDFFESLACSRLSDSKKSYLRAWNRFCLGKLRKPQMSGEGNHGNLVSGMRELKQPWQRWQQKHQKAIELMSKTMLCMCIMLFSTFFDVHCTTMMRNLLMQFFMEGVYIWKQIFLSPFEPG